MADTPLTLKELRARAVARLGDDAASLKTREELEAALALPLPAPVEPPPSEKLVLRDFFKEPGREALPPRYEDDQVLAFVRDPVALYASWDFSAKTWGAQGPATLRVVDGDQRVHASRQLERAGGGSFVETLPGGVPLRVLVEKRGRVLGTSAEIYLPARKVVPQPSRPPPESAQPQDREERMSAELIAPVPLAPVLHRPVVTTVFSTPPYVAPTSRV